MKTLLPLFLTFLLLSGCATSSTYSAKVQKPEKHYVGIFTLVADIDADFSRLDSATYEDYIRGKFNNLEQSRFRNQLEKTLKNSLEKAQTRIVNTSDIFNLNTDVSYPEFLSQIKMTGVDGILFVNLRNYWHDATLVSSYGKTVIDDTEPNALFHSYLIDTQTLQPVWYAKSVVNGIYAGYNTLNNTLARQLTRKLRKDKYIIGAPLGYIAKQEP
ncbi:hypothetical protein ACFSKU_20760 [Pontibacter silvestris]|uniref:Lipoprotein n=1 Tax=Pontibacter silvestris TaxID=2305183 RepID=A0ABW4X5G1_9BACT|nr:hypothetical protein [Pontibacter silvestris]MCC9137135.1 hypothetical protein [Pontibacter silvestris]